MRPNTVNRVADWFIYRLAQLPHISRALCVAILLTFGAATAHAQTPLDAFDPSANDRVHVILVQPDGKILICGDFSSVSPNGGAAVARKGIARFNPDGTLDSAFDPNAIFFAQAGAVHTMALQADGKIVVGGTFTAIGGQPRTYIARLDPNGAADSFNPSASASVRTVAVQADGKILAGGNFFTIGSQTRNFIARLDSATGLADSFNPNANNHVFCIVVQPDGRILAGGSFGGQNSIGGQTRNSIARLDPATGAADSFDPNANGIVFAIALQADGKILVGGQFNFTNSIGGQTRNFIARLDPATGAADSFDPNANGGNVYSIVVQPDGKILVGGDFRKRPDHVANIGGKERDRIARLDPSSGLADSFDPGANNSVLTFAVQEDGKILTGGAFTALSPDGGAAVTRNRAARLGTSVPPRVTLGNISTRLRVETGDNALIGGFIITGTQPKKVIIRAIGPSLPLDDKLANPTLELRNSSGVLVEANDDWQNSANRQAIIDSTIPPSNDLESAIVATLPANNAGYTAIVRGADNATGMGVVEAYDLDNTVDSKLANISTRGLVQTGDNVLIAGSIVVGAASQKVIVRAIGPSLDVPGKMENPTLELRDANGALIRANDNWRTGGQEMDIIATTIPPTNEFESAIVATLPANGASYTAIVRGVDDATGIAVVEVYALN